MPVLWVLGILALVAVLLLRARIRVLLSMRRRALALTVRAGFLRVQILLREERPKEKAPAEKPRKRPEKKEKEESPARRITFAQIRLALRTVPPLIWKMLKRILRGTRIDPLEIYISIGGREDPAKAAEQCGYVLTAIWGIMPRLEQILIIPEPFLDVEPDFDAAQTSIEGELGISIRIGTLIAAAFPLLMGLLHVWNEIRKDSREDERRDKRENKRKGSQEDKREDKREDERNARGNASAA